MNVFDHFIVIAYFFLENGFILWLSVCVGKENFGRHKGAVFFQNLADTIFVGKLQTFFVEEQGDFRTDGRFGALSDGVGGTAVAFPVNSRSAFAVGERINVYFVSYHKRRVEA